MIVTNDKPRILELLVIDKKTQPTPWSKVRLKKPMVQVPVKKNPVLWKPKDDYDVKFVVKVEVIKNYSFRNIA